MAVNGKQKGARAERALVKMFEQWWGGSFARTPGSGSFATRNKGQDYNAQGDIVTADPHFPFCVESKHQEGWTLDQLLTAPSCKFYSWWEQTVSETPPDRLPLLLFTKNRAPWFLAMREEDVARRGGEGFPLPTPFLVLHHESGPIVITLADWLWSTEKDAWIEYA